MIAYMSSDTSRKLHNSPIKNVYTCYADLRTACVPFSSIINRVQNSESTEYHSLIEELYQSPKLYISGENPNTETFQTLTEVQEEGNLFNLFLRQ